MRIFLLYLLGFLVLIAIEIFQVYWIMPFPGSQHGNTVGYAYFIHTHLWLLRIIGIAIIAYPLYYYLLKSKWWRKTIVSISLILYGLIFYVCNFILLADKMFYQPETKIFANASENKIDVYSLIIGVNNHGEQKAYPIELIGFHHQVQDTVGGLPLMVTYCTVCRTGRVFSPIVNAMHEQFRLVGMDHFNAMFEDATTKSWWRQENGECIAGKLKGMYLDEIQSEQMSLKSWLELYPDSKVMQPDPKFLTQYVDLAGYDKGTISGMLERTDLNSWQDKSWVIGVKTKEAEKVYDWNDLKKMKIISDTIKGVPVLLTLENDSTSFHTFSRSIDSLVLQFTYDNTTNLLTDVNTNSSWTMRGKCIDGTLKGSQLNTIQSYQEFWRAWQQFHPDATIYKN